MGVGEATQGWFEDPFQIHQYRWYSRGVATNLVRDGGVESYDAPPAGPPQGPLIPLGQNPPSAGAGRQGPIPRRQRRWVLGGVAAAVVAAVAVLALRSQSSPVPSEASAACSTSGALHYEPSGVVFATNEPLLSGVRLTRSGSGVTVAWSFHGPVNPRPGRTAEWQWVQLFSGPGLGGTGWSPLEINYGGGRWRAVVQVRRGSTTLGEVVGTPAIHGSTINAWFPASAWTRSLTPRASGGRPRRRCSGQRRPDRRWGASWRSPPVPLRRTGSAQLAHHTGPSASI
jgi:hypothetical protein